jgi:TatD DNase family protein
MPVELFDSHTHLDSEEFRADHREVIERALAHGVTHMVTVAAGGGLESAARVQTLVEAHASIWGTAGVHPHDAEAALDLDALAKFAAHPKVVAIGETGLDFYRDLSPRPLQEEWFRVQVELALRLNKPLIIHSREAGRECLAILRELKAEQVGGVFHCYSEDAAFAGELAGINFLISVPGSVTFKNARLLQEAVREIPLSQMMLETDAPYLAPVPYRGKRCESSHIVETAKAVAALKGLSFEEVAEQTTRTALSFFKIERT